MKAARYRQQRQFLENRITPLLLLVAILLLSLLLSGLISYFVSSQQRARFERETSAFDSLLRRRLETYQTVLISTRALWSTGMEIDHATFHRYTQDLNLKQRLPGAVGLGFAKWITPEQQSTFEAQQAREFPNYRVRPPLEQAGAPIVYIEPDSQANIDSLGYDMYSNALRRAAMQEARQLGQPVMTAPVALVQDQRVSLKRPAVLLYVPVMSGSELFGYAYMAVRIQDLLQSLSNEQDSQDVGLNIELYDGTQLLYGQAVAHPVFQETGAFKFAGRTWRVRYSASESFGRDWAASLPWLVLFLGTVVALSAYFSYLAQIRARQRAEEVSESLRVSRSKLERSRAEFEAIFRAMSDTALFTDTAGQVLFANDALQRYFGYAPQELRGQNVTLLRRDLRLASALEAVSVQKISAEEPVNIESLEVQRAESAPAQVAALTDEALMGSPERLTTLYSRKDGAQFYGEMQRNEVVSESGQLLGYLEVVHDISGRLEGERALKASEQRYHGVLEAVPSPLWVMNQLGEVTYQNAQYRAYFGSAPPGENVHPDEAAQYQQRWEHSRQRLLVFRSELRLLTEQGYRYFLVFGAPVLATDGQVREWVFSAGDIHDRLQAERKARQSEERYREVLEGMPQMVWLSNAAGEPTYFNQRWYDYAGPQQDPLPLLHPNDRGEFTRRWKEAREGGQFFEMEHRLRGQAGNYHTFMTRGVGIRGPRGELLEWVVTSTDIDDQVYAEWSSRLLAALSKQLSSNELSSGDLGDGLGSGGLRAALSLINERLAVLSALWVQVPGSAGAADFALNSLISQARGHVREGALLSNPQVCAAIARAEALTEPVVVEDPSLQEGGITGLVLLLLTPAREENGPSTYLALGFRQPIEVRDLEVVQEIAGRMASALESLRLIRQVQVTQQALQELNASLEQRVEERTTELAEANRELEAFSYSVSHDLRAPLRHIIAFGELIHKDADTTLGKKGTRYMGIINDSATRMNQLIDDLLEFSRTSRQPLHLGRVSLDALTQEVAAELQLSAPGNLAQWHIGPLPDVLGDASLLRQVLSNLLGNAAKYSSRGAHPEIWVNAVTEGREVVLSVRDNGVGFDLQYADKLFGVFQRLHRPEEFEGSGIGLANVRRIVVRHGGRVWAESVPGEGATFFCSLKRYE